MYLKIPESKLAQHFLICGDTGTGKTQLLNRILRYIRSIGDSAVVLDSKGGEFVAEHYSPRSGDHILNPADNRTSYWDLTDEFTDELDAMAITAAWYPMSPSNEKNEFFWDNAKRITAYVLGFWKPTCEVMGQVLCNPNILDRMIEGTEHAESLNPKAPPMRSGVLATMNKIGFGLRQMPRDKEKPNRSVFSWRSWTKNPSGFVFLSNEARTRDALRPIQSSWIDMAILNLMTVGKLNNRIWIVLDEVDSAGVIPKIEEGVTMLRSSGNPMILGIQNTAQLEVRYGKAYKTIFSQPSTTFVMRTRESESAKGIQNLIGEQEVITWKSSRTTGMTGGKERDSISGPDEKLRPLMLASEVQGLPDLCGYMLTPPTGKKKTIGLNIVPFELKYIEPTFHCKPIVHREIGSETRDSIETIEEIIEAIDRAGSVKRPVHSEVTLAEVS